MTAALVARVVVRTLGELMITAGVLTLTFVVWQLWWTDLGANREQSRLTSELEQRWATGAAPADVAAAPSAAAPGATPDAGAGVAPEAPPQVAAAPQAPAGEAFAILRIPGLGDGYEEPVLAGTSTRTLQRGIGHYEGTAGPGEVGNFAVAGHRTTYGAPFSRLPDLAAGDPVVVQTATAYHVYRVSAAEVVTPQDSAVIAPVPRQPGAAPTAAVLTMTTCHPRYSARERYVVHASLVSSVATPDEVAAVLAAGPQA